MARVLLPLALAVLACGPVEPDDPPPPPVCPAAVPPSGMPCDDREISCTYLACASTGMTTALCGQGWTWVIETTPCATTPCGEGTCPAGDVCVHTEVGNGGVSSACVAASCEGPVGCACPGCGVEVAECTSEGTTLFCEPCSLSSGCE